MPEELRPRAKDSLALSEARVRLAEKRAERYGELVEALLLKCAGERPAKATPPPRARGASRVIDLEQARKQKAQRP